MKFGLGRCCFVLGLCVYILAVGPFTLAQDDNENSTPTAWWIYSRQSPNDVTNTIKKLNARIIDIKADNPSGNSLTVTYVQNTGAYAKQWWWYVGIDDNALEKYLKVNNARLISLKAYDAGGGNIRFAVAMISNTGADNKSWWYYWAKSRADIDSLTKANKARLTTLESFTFKGQTLYSFIMIANTGKDDKQWWWFADQSPQGISGTINKNKARLLDLTYAGNGNFNAVMESCSSGCPYWWWYTDLDSSSILSKAQDNGARVLTADTYQGCGSNPCFAAVMIGDTQADITACDSQGCISEAKLSANICNTLANHVVGYSCLVGGMRPVSGGQARTNANPPSLAMSSDLVTNIASVSKTMTAIAILQLLAKDGLTIDTKISPYIYSDWKQGPYINQLTFKHLLTHSSGFAQLPQNACGNDITYSALKGIVAGGVSQGNIGQASYGNCNFALLRELMPALLGQKLSNVPDAQRAQQSSSLYINYVNSHVFNPVGVATRQCKPPSGSNDILSYPLPAGNASGTDWGDWSLSCGSGGWVLSADDIFRVINDVATGNTLLNKAQRKQMLDNCLGWDCAVRPDCPSPNVCKNGDLYNGNNISVWTYAGILKCNVPVVVVVNSRLPAPWQGGEDIIGLVANALKGASASGNPRSCP